MNETQNEPILGRRARHSYAAQQVAAAVSAYAYGFQSQPKVGVEENHIHIVARDRRYLVTAGNKYEGSESIPDLLDFNPLMLMRYSGETAIEARLGAETEAPFCFQAPILKTFLIYAICRTPRLILRVSQRAKYDPFFAGESLVVRVENADFTLALQRVR